MKSVALCLSTISCLLMTGVATATGIQPDLKVLHVLNRLTYGPAPGDVQKVRAMGVEKFIRMQLDPESIPLPSRLQQQLDTLDTLRMDPVELFREYGPPRPGKNHKPDPEAVKAARQRARVIVEQAVQARLWRATESPRQLQELMVDFWFNHFNVYAPKGLDHLWIGAYEEQAIRPYALGHFRDLLGATAHHPAMLFYLDNWQNTAPDSPGARGRFEGINENYARELMELHTLGVNGGYTQNDVIALAHIFTGWGLGRPRDGGQGGFRFDPRRHDDGDKTFLGRTIEGSGEDEGEQALDILARAPATARHISYELAQYFVADDPPPALVERLSRRFLATDGDIRAVLDTLFHSREFWDRKYYANKFKTPYQFIVSAVRASGIDPVNVRPLYGMLMQLGMPLYACLTPDGYRNTRAAWLNPDAMTRRISFATALASGRLPLGQPGFDPGFPRREMERMTPDKAPVVDPVSAATLADTLDNLLSAQTQSAIDAAPKPLRAALILGSPEFMQH
ncbi:MAG: DUF1800 domain-containing protein [Sulfuricaulis sp.]